MIPMVKLFQLARTVGRRLGGLYKVSVYPAAGSYYAFSIHHWSRNQLTIMVKRAEISESPGNGLVDALVSAAFDAFEMEV